MKEETKTVRLVEQERLMEIASNLTPCLPIGLSDRDNNILILKAFNLSTREIGKEVGCSHDTVANVLNQHPKAVNTLASRKKAVMCGVHETNTLLAALRNRDFLLSDKSKPQTVAAASLLASLGSQAAKIAQSMSDTSDPGDNRPASAVVADLDKLVEPK